MNPIQIIIEAINRTDSAFSAVQGNLEGFAKQNKAAVDASKKFTLAVGGAALAVGAFSIGEAREHIATQKQLEAVLKSTGNAAGLFAEDINDQAAALAKMTNFQDDAIVGAQNLLLTFTNIKGPVFQGATEAVLNMSAALGQDLKSSSVQLGKALNDPINGISALSRVGVSFTESQKEMIAGMVEAGNTAGAQGLILKELEREFGGSAKALADPWIQFKNQMGEVAESIGMALLPAFNRMIGTMLVFLEKIPPIISWLEKNKVVIYTVAGAIMGAMVPAFVAWAAAAIPAAIAVAAALAPFIVGGAVIGAVVAGFVWLWNNADRVQKAIASGFDWLSDKVVDAVNAMLWPIRQLIDLFNKAKGLVGGGLSAAGGAIAGATRGLLGFASGGTVPGPLGMPQLAMVHGGERVMPANGLSLAGGGGAIVINLNGDMYATADVAQKFADEIARIVRYQLRI